MTSGPDGCKLYISGGKYMDLFYPEKAEMVLTNAQTLEKKINTPSYVFLAP